MTAGILPPDVKQEWLNVIRHVQAACRENDGFAVVRLSVIVKGNTPLLWLESDVARIHPKSAANINVTPKLLMALGALADAEDTAPD